MNAHSNTPNGAASGSKTRRAAFKDFIVAHPGFLLTFLVVFFSSFGITYEYILLNYFRINFFHYADLDDFMISSGKILWVINNVEISKGIAILLSGAVVVFLVSSYLFFVPDYPNISKIVYAVNLLTNLFILFLILMALVLFYAIVIRAAEKLGGEISRGKGAPVKITLRDKSVLPAKGSQLFLISGVNAAYFYYEIRDDNTRKVHVVPAQHLLHQVEYLVEKKGPSPGSAAANPSLVN